MEARLHKWFHCYGCFPRQWQFVCGDVAGRNYQANAILVVRPEIRYDWSTTDFPGDYNRAIFGIDAVPTF